MGARYRLGSSALRYEMVYGESNGHITDDVKMAIGIGDAQDRARWKRVIWGETS